MSVLSVCALVLQICHPGSRWGLFVVKYSKNAIPHDSRITKINGVAFVKKPVCCSFK